MHAELNLIAFGPILPAANKRKPVDSDTARSLKTSASFISALGLASIAVTDSARSLTGKLRAGRLMKSPPSIRRYGHERLGRSRQAANRHRFEWRTIAFSHLEFRSRRSFRH